MRRTATPKKVVIVGAGLAGLSAAYALSESGHQVIVLEARTRPGGRVYTLREPFSDGLYVEAGALFIADSHELAMRYLKLFRLPLVQVSPRHLATLFFLRGRRVRVDEDGHADWPLDLTRQERRLGFFGMSDRYVSSGSREMGDISDPGWPPKALLHYDRITFSEFLRRQGASPAAAALLRASYFDVWGDGIDTVSALFLLRDHAFLTRAKEWYSVKGGNDQLPKAFAARLAEHIVYGAPIVRIEHTQREVRATFLQAGSPQTITGDHLVVAIPFSVLRCIEVRPRFSAAKQRAIQDLPYTSIARVFLQSRKRSWAGDGPAAWAGSDLPIMLVREPTYNQPGPRGILESYMAGPQARRVATMQEDERIRFTLEHMEQVFPGLRQHFEAGVSKCWDEDPWARGDYAWFRPGQMESLLPHIARAEGRVHFAGDHTSAMPGWMEGALQSGQRAALEIDEAP